MDDKVRWQRLHEIHQALVNPEKLLMSALLIQTEQIMRRLEKIEATLGALDNDALTQLLRELHRR